jgi:beta-lactam-binding protein with PASTA domain
MSKKNLSNIPFYILTFGILFFLSAIIFSQIILKSETVSVPDLTGMRPAEAKGLLEKKDISLSQRGSEFNDQWPKGRIVRQIPAPGSKIRVTKVIQVFVSSGSEKVSIPALEGRSLEAALPLLKESGLFKGKLTQIHTPRFPAGKILAQRPQAEEAAERNSAVGFLVSQGDWEERFVMPDLIGKNAAKVMEQLKALDFKIGDIRYTYYPGLGKGIIIKQFPLNGYKIQKRNLITLEVSR